MLIEDLKTLVADLLKQSEEAVPVFGDGSKKEWMANHLDYIIDEDGDALECLLKFDLLSDVIDYLEDEYKERKDEDHDPNIPCEERLDEKGFNEPAVSCGQANLENGMDADASFSNRRDNMNGISGDTALENENEPVLVIEEDIVILRDDENCGC